MHKFCRAKPKICFDRGYTTEQVIVVWNSHTIENKHIKENIEEKPKTVKNLSQFNDYITKKELRDILTTAKCPSEIWYKYFEEPFPQKEKKEVLGNEPKVER